MKQFKQSNKSPVGTSFHDDVINTTVNKLIKVLGKPQCDSNDGRDKINFEWNMELADGNVFTVYDYKEYRKLDLDEIIEWHIGGKHPDVTGRAKICIKQDLEQVKDEWDKVIDLYKETHLDHYHHFEEWNQEHQPLLNFLKTYFEAPTRKPIEEKPKITDVDYYTINVFHVKYKGVEYVVRWNESYDDNTIDEWDILDEDGTIPSQDTIYKLIDYCTPKVKTI